MWKDISGFDGRYEVSDVGEIRNKNRQNILTLKVDRDGYYQIGLRKLGDRNKNWYYVHRIVAECYLDETDDMINQVDHIDQDRKNNCVSNLRWVSVAQNNLNRKLDAWKSNITTGELYITKYRNGYMIRINRSDYKKRIWERDLDTAIKRRDECIEEIRTLAVGP